MRIVILLALLTLPLPAFAQPARKDTFGDPLPAGALARLGTVRLRPGGAVKHLAFSPDAKQLAVWCEGSETLTSFVLYDVKTGQELRRVEWGGYRSYEMAWLADGRGVVVVQGSPNFNEPGRFDVWEFTDTKSDLSQFKKRLVFSPGGEATPGDDSDALAGVAVSRDGKWLAAGHRGLNPKQRDVLLWKLETGKGRTTLPPPRKLGMHDGNVQVLAFSADSKQLVSLSRVDANNARMTVWDLANNKSETHEMPYPYRSDHVRNPYFAVGGDPDLLALSSLGGAVALVDLKTGQRKKNDILPPLIDKKTSASSRGMTFSSDGQLLYLADGNGTVHRWNLKDAKPDWQRVMHRGYVSTVAVSRDGRIGASGAEDGGIVIWDAQDSRDNRPIDAPRGFIWNLQWTGRDRQLVTSGNDNVVRRWDASTGERLKSFPLVGRSGGGSVLFLDPLQREFLSTSQKTLTAWNLESGERVKLPASLDDVKADGCRLSDDRRTLLTWNRERVQLWDWPTGKRTRTIEAKPKEPGETKTFELAALSPDGKYLFTVSSNYTLQGKRIENNRRGVSLWSVADGKLLREHFEREGQWINQVVFTEDGKEVLLTGNANIDEDPQNGRSVVGIAVQMFDALTLQPKQSYERPAKEPRFRYSRFVRHAAVSPHGKLVAAAEQDAVVVVYERATGLVRGELRGHRQQAADLAFSADSQRLASSSFDGTGLVWDLRLTSLADKPAMKVDADKLWDELATRDAKLSRAVLAQLAGDADGTLKRVEKQLRPYFAPDAAELDRLVMQLESAAFAERQAAFTKLDGYGPPIVAGLRARFRLPATLEGQRRVQQLLEKHDPVDIAPQRLRELRALELLEEIAGPRVEKLLAALAAGSPEAPLTHDARSTLARLKLRDVK